MSGLMVDVPTTWRPTGAAIRIGTDAAAGAGPGARTPTATLIVQVAAAADGAPIAGVTLTTATQVARTDASGQAVIAVPVGPWRLRAARRGWGTMQARGLAQAGQTTRVAITLAVGSLLSLADYIMRADADLPIGAGDHALWDSTNKTGLRVLAKALRYARDPEPPVAWRTELLACLAEVQGSEIDPVTEARGSSGAIGMGLLAYVLAAEQLDLSAADTADFRAWLALQLTTANSDGRSLVAAQAAQGTSIGLYAAATLVAAYRYLDDETGIATVAARFRAWLGEPGGDPTQIYDTRHWQADPEAPVGINRPGATLTWQGAVYAVDGLLPEAMRRWDDGSEGLDPSEPGEVTYPWPATGLTAAWTDLQGAITTAWLLASCGYPAWDWGQQALLRAVRWLQEAGAPAAGDDTALMRLINAAYGTRFEHPEVTRAMKHLGYLEVLMGVPPIWYQVADVARLQRDGIWMDRAAGADLSQTSLAWWELLRRADQAAVPACWNQNSGAEIILQAAAMVWLATGDTAYREKAIAGCLAAIGTEVDPSTGARASSLALGRNLGGYVIAADLAGLAEVASAEDAARFATWIREMIHTLNSDGRDLVLCGRVRANNWGTCANVSLLAAYAYLGDEQAFQSVAAICQSLLGARWIYTGWEWKYDWSWHADATEPVGINPAGTRKPWDNPYLPEMIGQTYSIDGVLPEEMRRWDGVVYIAPPPSEGYAWEGLQGYVAQAHILSRAGYPAWEWEDQALRRAVDWLHAEPVNFNNFVWLAADQPVTLFTNYNIAAARGAVVNVQLRRPDGTVITEAITLDAVDSATPVHGAQVCRAVLAVSVPFDLDSGYSLKIYSGDMECGILEGDAGTTPYAVGFPAAGDDLWQIYLINAAYGTDYPTATPTQPGKTVGFTDWTHPAGPEDYAPVAAHTLGGRTLALYDADELTTLWQDVAGTIPVTAAGQTVARIDDLSGAGRHATQSDPTKRPLYQIQGGHGVLVPDRANDALEITIPSGGWAGSLLYATPGGTLTYGVSLPAGTYNILTAGDGLYMPGTQWCGIALRVPVLHPLEAAALRGWYQARGAGAAYAGVTSLTNYWRGRTELTSFDATAAAGAWQALGSAWRGCSALTAFPVLDLHSVTGAANAWRDCTALSTFPGSSLAGSPCTDWTSAWQSCALGQASVDSILITLAANGRSAGVLGIQSGTNATPAAAGKAAADTLRARGWTVTLNGY